MSDLRRITHPLQLLQHGVMTQTLNLLQVDVQLDPDHVLTVLPLLHRQPASLGLRSHPTTTLTFLPLRRTQDNQFLKRSILLSLTIAIVTCLQAQGTLLLKGDTLFLNMVNPLVNLLTRLRAQGTLFLKGGTPLRTTVMVNLLACLLHAHGTLFLEGDTPLLTTVTVNLLTCLSLHAQEALFPEGDIAMVNRHTVLPLQAQ